MSALAYYAITVTVLAALFLFMYLIQCAATDDRGEEVRRG